MIVHAGNDVDSGEHSSIAAGSASLYSHYGNQPGDSLGIGESLYLSIQL